MIQDALSALAGAGSVEDLDARFRPLVARYGFDAYAGGILAGGEETVMFLFNWPQAWVKHYAANGYAARDAAIQEACRSQESFTWSELIARKPLACPEIFAAARGFGWTDGLAVSVHGPALERGVVSLAAPSLSLSAQERRDAEALCRAAYSKGRELHYAGSAPISLTAREREVLALVAEGLDDAAIAGRLGIARVTAHSHVERAKTRLGATSRAQAVAIALRRGLLVSLATPFAAWLVQGVAVEALALLPV